MAQITTEPAIWSSLDWSQLYDNDPMRNMQRRQIALEVLNQIKQGQHVALDAKTGAGKAIILILAHLGLEWNTLFVVPTVELAYQHQKLFQKLTGHHRGTLVMTGNKSPLKRTMLWHDDNPKLVFATPHVIMNDINKKIYPFGYFPLLVIDEFHHAHYHYPFVPLAERANRGGAIICSLSATADDLFALKNCFVTKIVKADIKMPKKISCTTVVQPTKSLSQADDYCRDLLTITAEELADLHLVSKTTPWLTEHQLINANEVAEQLPYPKNKDAVSAIGRYRSLSHMRFLLNLCSYQNYLWYADNLYNRTEKYTEWIINHQRFNELTNLVRQFIANDEPHPKVAQFIKTACYRVEQGDNFIAFVKEKITGRYLAEQLSNHGLKVDVAFGGAERKHIKEVRQLMESELINGIIATSVLAEGVSLPSVDTIIHYDRPLTKVERIQKDGRAGRGYKPGLIIPLMLNYPSEWAGGEKTSPAVPQQPQLPKSNTGWLFPPEEMLKTEKTNTPNLPFTEEDDKTSFKGIPRLILDNK